MRRNWAYLKVVLRHKYFVFKACQFLGVPLWIALVHDWRKFLPSQWIPYARYFYKDDGSKRTDTEARKKYDPDVPVLEFQKAWLDHQRARHHWEAWCVIGDKGALVPVPMPRTFVYEMVADWMGAGLAYDNYDPKVWWQKNASNVVLESGTEALVTMIINGLPGTFLGRTVSARRPNHSASATALKGGSIGRSSYDSPHAEAPVGESKTSKEALDALVLTGEG